MATPKNIKNAVQCKASIEYIFKYFYKSGSVEGCLFISFWSRFIAGSVITYQNYSMISRKKSIKNGNFLSIENGKNPRVLVSKYIWGLNV